jgi:hypothetical protein
MRCLRFCVADHTLYILLYTSCSVGSVVCVALSLGALMGGGLRAARALHRRLLRSVMHVSMAFWDQQFNSTNAITGSNSNASAARGVQSSGSSVGGGSGGVVMVTQRLVNRFARDMHTIDEKLAYTFHGLLSSTFTVRTTVSVCCFLCCGCSHLSHTFSVD